MLGGLNLDVMVGRLALAVERGEEVVMGSELESFINWFRLMR